MGAEGREEGEGAPDYTGVDHVGVREDVALELGWRNLESADFDEFLGEMAGRMSMLNGGDGSGNMP